VNDNQHGYNLDKENAARPPIRSVFMTMLMEHGDVTLALDIMYIN